jgi:hypothetical protein
MLIARFRSHIVAKRFVHVRLSTVVNHNAYQEGEQCWQTALVDNFDFKNHHFD